MAWEKMHWAGTENHLRVVVTHVARFLGGILHAEGWPRTCSRTFTLTLRK
jgi:hypothetical protein